MNTHYIAADSEGAEGVGSEFAADTHTVAAVGGQDLYDYAEPEGKGVPEEAVDPQEWDEDEGFDF
uniref:Uncharacterized protein n=1 Tax=Leersia perrieri TaxID=77586 RepID=A0A0D9XYP9_9ORYZ